MPPRKRASDTPGPIDLNLDTIEREGAVDRPFTFVIDGHRYVAGDPSDIDWKRLVSIVENPAALFEAVLSPDDYERFQKATIPGWKLARLGEAFMKHYGLPTSPGESVALSS